MIGFVERNQRKEWFDDECRRALAKKNAARARMIQHETRQNVELYKALRKQQTRLFQEKKRQLEESGEQELEQLFHTRDTRKFYRGLNTARSGYTPKTEMCRGEDGSILTDEREVIARWKRYYDGHLNGAQAGDRGDGVEDHISRVVGDEVPPPSVEEVTGAVKQLKLNKSAGSDGLGAELFKMGQERLAICMHQLIVKIWEQEELPDEWKMGVIHPVYKNGDRLDCANFRAITVLNAAYKILSRILYCRLSPLASDFVGSYQAGFVGGKSTTDQIFTLRQILQKCREHRIPTHHLFIDFKAAYDTIDRTELWKTMQQYGFPGKLIRLLRATMDRVQCRVRISSMLSDPFESHRGLRQGEGVIRSAGFDHRGTIFTRSVQLLGYADDIDIIGRSTATVSDAYTRLKRAAAGIGLEINASKTKYLLAGGSDRDRARLGASVRINNDELEVVEEFAYLGSLITSDNNISSEIRRRIVQGSPAYHGLHKLLRSRRLRQSTKCTIYRTLIRPVVLYGHESWTLLTEDANALGIFERRVLRTIFGGVYVQDGWRRRMNHELAELFGEPDILTVAKAGRIRWLGHVMRMPDSCPTKKTLVSDPLGTRRRGAQRARWLDQVEQDLRNIGCHRGWRAATTNRATWKTIGDQAMSARRAQL
uniref:Reverse transcriptase domain-containing protein n=1 Tax=Anopheles atroparvus TaxID=41427 RepID=A0AAG5DNL5_ANOAO